MVRAALILSLVAAASATKLIAFKGKHQPQKNLLPIGASSKALNLGLEGSCDSFETVCDVDYCVPLLGECCNEGNGAYCEVGKSCVTNGCCPIGSTCTGETTCESSDEKLCGYFCIPLDAECCDEDLGTFCESGDTCSAGGCSSGGGTLGGSGDGSSGDDDSSSDDDLGGSGSSSDDQCYSWQEECGDGCMPTGSVCCDSELEYCLVGQTCNNDGTCDSGLGDIGDDFTFTDSLDLPTASSGSFSGSSSVGSNSLPTGLVSGGPDDSDSNDSSGDSNSNSNDNNDSNGGDEPDDAMTHGPSLIAVIVALIPLLL